MVSNYWPSKRDTSTKCWWIPLDVQSFEQKKTIRSICPSSSSQKGNKQLETKSPINGLTTTKFVSAVSGIWEYIGDPEVLQNKGSLNNNERVQNQILTSSSSEIISEVSSARCTVLSELKSNFEELKTIKKQLLFASCSSDLVHSFTWKHAHISSSYLPIESYENHKSGSNVSGDSENSFEGRSKDFNLRDLAEPTSYGSNATNNTSATPGKHASAYISAQTIDIPIFKKSEDASYDMSLNVVNSHPGTAHSCSLSPPCISKEAIIVLRNPGSDLHVGYHTEFTHATGVSVGKNQEASGSCTLVTKTSLELSNSKNDYFQDAEKHLMNELILDRHGYINNWLALRCKLQDVFAKNRHAIAGALAGTLVSLCLHPVDTVKTIIQADVTGTSFHQIVRRIISEKGILGLYRGIASNIATSAPISAIYTLTYESVKGAVLPLMPQECNSFAHCFAGGCASVATSVIFTPSERIKQQMQVSLHYRNCWNALIGCLEKGGFMSLYAGWGAVLCRNIPHSIIKFYTYESLKQAFSKMRKHDDGIGTLETLVCGGLAGSTAALFTTPFDVVKTRLQTQAPGTIGKYDSVLHALKEISRQEGLQGLYRGLVPRLAMYVSQGAIFFASYEFLKAILALEAHHCNARSIHKKPKVESSMNKLPS